MTELGITFSGVPIQRRMIGVNDTPKIVRIIPMTTAKTTVVWIASSIPSLSFAPKHLEIITLAPTNTP